MPTTRPQPYSLELQFSSLDDLQARLPLIIANQEEMNRILFQDLATVAASVGTGSGGSSSLPDPVTIAHGGTGAITAAAARAALGLAIGTNVEAQSSELDGLAALAANGLIARTAAATYAARTLAAGAGITSITNADGVSGNPTIVGITKLATSVTGAQNNYAPGLLGHTIEYWSGASDAAFTGLAGGVAGQLYTLKNTGTKVATFANQSGSSSAGNKFTNLVTSAATPVASKGFITYQYDGTDWQLVAHEQGAFITAPFAAGDFTGNAAMTWIVAAGNVTTSKYKLEGKKLTYQFYIVSTSIGGTPNANLQLGNGQWGGFSNVSVSLNPSFVYNDAGGGNTPGMVQGAFTTFLPLEKLTAGNWAGVASNLNVFGTVIIEVS